MKKERLTKLSVLMSGPLPPAVGGMATVINGVSTSELCEKVDLQTFDTAKKTREGRSLFTAIGYRIRLWRLWIRNLRDRPDVVHIHTCSGFTFFLDAILALIAFQFSIPVVIHIHGGKFKEFVDQLHYPLRKFAIYVLRKSSAVIALSEEWKQYLVSELGLDNVFIIRNGVPDPHEPRLARDDGIAHIVFLGKICTSKGIPELLQALSKLSSPYHMYLAGDFGGDISEEDLEKMIKETSVGPDSCISVTGVVSGQRKLDLLANTDIFVLPSHAEGLPMSVIEAMARAIPVITTRVGGLPGLIIDEKNGLLIDPVNIDQLAVALRKLAFNEDFAKKIGERGRQTFLSKYALEITLSDYINLYKQLTTRSEVVGAS